MQKYGTDILMKTIKVLNTNNNKKHSMSLRHLRLNKMWQKRPNSFTPASVSSSAPQIKKKKNRKKVLMWHLCRPLRGELSRSPSLLRRHQGAQRSPPAQTQTECSRLTGFLNVSSLAKFSFRGLRGELGPRWKTLPISGGKWLSCEQPVRAAPDKGPLHTLLQPD